MKGETFMLQLFILKIAFVVVIMTPIALSLHWKEKKEEEEANENYD